MGLELGDCSGLKDLGYKIEHLLIGEPTETTENEQLPIVLSHANILDSLVDDFGFAY